MLMSSNRQAVSSTRPDWRNSSADAKVSARRPDELRSLWVERLTETSSSTIETSGPIDAFSSHPLLSFNQNLIMLYTNHMQHENSTVPWFSANHCPLVQVGDDLVLAGRA